MKLKSNNIAFTVLVLLMIALFLLLFFGRNSINSDKYFEGEKPKIDETKYSNEKIAGFKRTKDEGKKLEFVGTGNGENLGMFSFKGTYQPYGRIKITILERIEGMEEANKFETTILANKDGKLSFSKKINEFDDAIVEIKDLGSGRLLKKVELRSKHIKDKKDLDNQQINTAIRS